MARDEAYQHALDTEYEVWRRGYNPDSVDRDRVRDQFDAGYTADESAADHCSRLQARSWIEVEEQPYPES